ncbi:MAG: argininosuccinate synthase [Dehalococcoidia bacterium]
MPEKIVLAYSGGLDTSVAIRWLIEDRGYDVVALTVDVGAQPDFKVVEERGLKAGALKVVTRDVKDVFLQYFAFPALMAGAVYEEQYPLATALARPLIAKLLVDVAREEGATAVAHGCTGKGNDQVRFDVSITALAPDLTIVAPARETSWTRDEAIEIAERNSIPIEAKKASPYSTDENLWGRSIEAGILEDPWETPPEDVYQWTRSIRRAPDTPAIVEIEFDHGVPVALDGERLDSVSLVTRLNELAGAHGIGRVDMVENRLVGIKSREIYEAPAAVTLLKAHQALEQLTLSKLQVRFKQRVAQEYADLIYNGQWFSAHHQDLAAYVHSTQRFVTGAVRVELYKGNCTVQGKKSPRSLYVEQLATYSTGDLYDQSAAIGFIKIHGLPVQVQAEQQLLPEHQEPLRIAMPE